jgi:cobalt/nickel transport system ATP-binding protein
MSARPVLEARDLVHSYDGERALDGLSVAVAAGAKVALVGPNGAGKSTLLLALSGAIRPERGAVLLDGQAVRFDAEGLRRFRAAVQLVVQDPDDQLFAPTVAEDVSFGPLNLGCPPAEVSERVASALAALDIAPLADKPIHALSHGEKQRVALAGSIAMRPRVLLLDEPTSGLDAAGREMLLAALDRLREGGAALVLATHDADLACRWADELIVVHAGRRLAHGPPAEALLSRAVRDTPGIGLPVALAIGLALRERGVLAAGDPLPTSPEGALAALRSGLARERSGA